MRKLFSSLIGPLCGGLAIFAVSATQWDVWLCAFVALLASGIFWAWQKGWLI